MAPAARRRRQDSRKGGQSGQGLAEFALILVLVVIVAIAGLTFFGTAVSGYVSSIGTSV